MLKAEFVQRVRDMERRLYRVSRTMLKNPHDCEDCVQEALFKAWNRIETLREDRYFETWLIRILINECKMMLKKPSERESALDESIPCIPEGDSSVACAIMRLAEKERIVLVLHAVEGYSVREISDIVRAREGTVKWRLKKARDGLKEILKEEELI